MHYGERNPAAPNGGRSLRGRTAMPRPLGLRPVLERSQRSTALALGISLSSLFSD